MEKLQISKGTGCAAIGCTGFIAQTVYLIVMFAGKRQAVAPFKETKSQVVTSCSQCARNRPLHTGVFRVGKVLIVDTSGAVIAEFMAKNSLKGIAAAVPADRGILICASSKITITTGVYGDKSIAYQIQCEFCTIDWVTGEVITRTTLPGSEPPEIKRFGQSCHGSDPLDSQLDIFILSLQTR